MKTYVFSSLDCNSNYMKSSVFLFVHRLRYPPQLSHSMSYFSLHYLKNIVENIMKFIASRQ